ncbi:hypothetical protein PoB_000376000 [Plakobranchus ocellatus]|uniref:Uncharacterized protein n=1 Tax=Plakobranchus ocellatus TaxID=259542 RepID=A0AAV3Y2C8_9GAST|nr:hypothetical protein PoB_000376000 [Plakobranchus ocellatus]
MSSKLASKEQELADKTAQNEIDVQHMKDFLKREYEEKVVKIKSECNEKMSNLEVLLHEAQQANATLETQLNNTLKEKDREITKISMEYDSRLALSERQKVQLMQQQQQVLNQDVLRKKMQHMKETYEKELGSLRTQLSELQQSCQQQRADCRQLQHQWQNQSHNISPRQAGHRSRPNSKGRSLSMSKHTF